MHERLMQSDAMIRLEFKVAYLPLKSVTHEAVGWSPTYVRLKLDKKWRTDNSRRSSTLTPTGACGNRCSRTSNHCMTLNTRSVSSAS